MKRVGYIALVWLALAGCAGGLGLRGGAAPAPAFEELTREELQSTMGRLALQVDALEVLLSNGGRQGLDNQELVATLLEQMLEQANELDSATSAHPDTFTSRLRQDIDVALHAVRKPTPDYESARRLSSSCTYCHQRRRFQQVTLNEENP